MKNLTEIITAGLIILFFGFLFMQNCDYCKSISSKEKTTCSKETAKLLIAVPPSILIDTTKLIERDVDLRFDTLFKGR